MRSEQFEHIQGIRYDFHQVSERVRDSLNSTIEKLARELYSRNPHFIFELIQNAEDNTYKGISPSLVFRLARTDPTGCKGSEGALIIENNETGFTRADVHAICKAGDSPKEKAQDYIGEKGIGFKSVFLVTDNPHIFSNGYHFCLPERDEETGFGYIVPQWVTPPEGFDLTQTHIILPLTKPDFGYDELEAMLLDIEPETILFLSKLQEIGIKTDSGTDYSILKNDSNRPMVEILVDGKKQHRPFSEVDEFLVCTEVVNKPADVHHEKREGIENREVSIAFPLDENSARAGKIFAYLPVRSDTRFPFLINADFILPSSREDILKEEPWNNWLMNCVADVVASMLLPALKEKRLLTADFLEKLASRLNDFDAVYGVDRDSLYNPIFTRVREAFMNEELLPANDETFVSARNAKLARGNPTRNLLNHQQLGDLFESTNELKWLSDDITEGRTPALQSFLMDINVEEIRPSVFVSRLSEQFLEQQCDEWFIKFYRFLSTHSRELRNQLPTKPILRLQDGTHVNPSPEGAPPNAYLPIGMDIDTVLPIIKAKLIKDEEVREFLRNGLKVPEWDIVEEVIKYILPKYKHEVVPLEDHKTHFAKIERAYNTDSSDEKKSRLRNKLRGTRFIRAENAVAGEPRYLKPEQLYFGSDDLRLYFDGNDSRNFINDEYPPSARELFKKLGIMDTVKVTKKQPNYERHIVIRGYWGDHARGIDEFDPAIEVDGLEHAINHPNPKKSEFIWNLIAKPNSHCIRGIVEKSTNQDYRGSSTKEDISDNFGRLLIETAWLPDSTGQMHKPSELTVDKLPESFVRDANLVEQLGMKKDEVAELADKTGIPLKVIEVLKKPGMSEKFEEFLEREGTAQVNPTSPIRGVPAFPERPVKNPERRATMLDKELENMPAKEYERLLRSVRVNSARKVARAWLKAEYTNNDGQMICQVCEREMPFKKRDGEYYFEAVEALNEEHFTKEHETQFLALCPECAARYQEFIKKDEDAMREIIDQLMVSENLQIPLQLGELKTNLRFGKKHWQDIKQILEST